MVIDRLNLQHYLWKDQTGYLLHPSIPLSGIENLKIADVGTGTGYVDNDLIKSEAAMVVIGSVHISHLAPISALCHSNQKRKRPPYKQSHPSNPIRPHRIWLLDLARTLPPNAQLDGFDIDIDDCPHEQWLPPNVTMRQLDALGEIPEHLAGMYDVVQLRLFQVVVKDNDPGPLLRNMLRMLSGCSLYHTHIYIHRHP